MNHWRTLTFCAAMFGLMACDSSDPLQEEADYKGQFYTQEGSCPGSADLTIHTEKGRIEVGFYCFIRACFVAKGSLSQSGYFEIRTGPKHYVKGRLSPDRARGEWNLIINNQGCHGRFEAERVSPYKHQL